MADVNIGSTGGLQVPGGQVSLPQVNAGASTLPSVAMDIKPPNTLEQMNAGANVAKTQQETANLETANKTQDFALKVSKLQQERDILGTVLLQDPKDRPAAWEMAKKQGEALGLDMSQVPAQYDPTWATNMYVQSEKAMGFYQKQIELAKLALQKVSAQGPLVRAAADASKAGNPALSNFAAQQAQSLTNTPTPTSLIPGQGEVQAPPAGNPGAIPMVPQAGQAPAPQGMPNGQPMDTNNSLLGTNQTSLQGPAELELEKKKAEAWQAAKQETLEAVKAGEKTMPFVQDVRKQLERPLVDIGENGIPNVNLTGPIGGQVGKYVGAGASINKDAANFVMEMLKGLKGIGNRVMNTEFSTLGAANPSATTPEDVNRSILNMREFQYKWDSFRLDALNTLEQKGIRDPAVAESILNRVYQNIEPVNFKTGKIDVSSVAQAKDVFNNILKHGIDSPAARPLTYQSPAGKVYSPEELSQAQAALKMTRGEIISKYGLKPAQVANNPLKVSMNATNLPNPSPGSVPPVNIPTQMPTVPASPTRTV